MIDQKIKPDQLEGSLIIVGANHRSSTMLLRDRLYISETALPSFYQRLRDAGFNQAIIFSTTDLTEIIIATPQTSLGEASAEVVKLLAAHAGESRSEIEGQTYTLSGQEAVRHLFAVASALDSLVVGDTQLLGQLRSAHRLARTNGMVGTYLDTLIGLSQRTAERISRETEISHRPVSIAAAAVQVARDLHGDLARSTCLLIGAGEMGEMLASSMLSAGLGNLIVTHPSEQRADTLGQNLNCHVGTMDDLPQLLSQADIVLTAMNTRRFILDAEMLKAATIARRRKPIFVIDTGVPGDVDPAAEALEDVFLYTLDDLERVTREGRVSRAQEAETAWTIVDEEAGKVEIGIAQTDALESDETDNIEEMRQAAIKEAGGDAEWATKILVQRLKDLPKNIRDT
ncbi:MAG: glutamyl-tRNA reductase [Rhodospirillaceae bacterium]|nr:glutamyl-tRNA reductase [Rhodospirillaceae bacterium]MBT7268451.1 glutamyl-tRNA reductase [Rhodospirillaceae bacterium]